MLLLLIESWHSVQEHHTDDHKYAYAGPHCLHYLFAFFSEHIIILMFLLFPVYYTDLYFLESFQGAF